MADLTGATILKDDELETIISKPKPQAVQINSAERPDYPGMTDEEILQQMGADPQSQMMQDQVQVQQAAPEGQYIPEPSRIPQQAAPGVNATMIDQAAAGLSQAPKPIVQGQKRPVPPPPSAQNALVPKEIKYQKGEIPSRTEITGPEATVGKAKKELKKSSDYQVERALEGMTQEINAREMESSGLEKNIQGTQDINERDKALLEQKKKELDQIKLAAEETNRQRELINQDISKKMADDPSFADRTLGNRVGWAISTFLAGVGGKGESVLSMLNSELDRNARDKANKIAAYAKMYKSKSPTDKADPRIKELTGDVDEIYKRILLRDQLILNKKLDNDVLKAKDPVIQSKYIQIGANIKNELAKSDVDLAKYNLEKRNKIEEDKRYKEGVFSQAGKPLLDSDFVTKEMINNKINIPNSKYSFVATTDNDAAKKINNGATAIREILAIYKDIEKMRKKYGPGEWVAGKLGFGDKAAMLEHAQAFMTLTSAEGGLSNSGVISPGELPVLQAAFGGGNPQELARNWDKIKEATKKRLINKLNQKLKQEKIPPKFWPLMIN